MAKKKSYYKQVMESVDKQFPDLPYNEKQKYAGRINEFLKENDLEGATIDSVVSSYVGSEKNSSKSKVLRR